MSDYEDGKRRRYEFMFAVNGGAFAIVSLWVREVDGLPDAAAFGATPIFGLLTARQVGWGMALFSAIMFVDIWAFGWAHRLKSGGEVFRLPGWAVLVGIATLLVCGWLFAMEPMAPAPPLLAGCVVPGLVVLAWFASASVASPPAT